MEPGEEGGSPRSQAGSSTMFLQKGDAQVLLPGKWRQDQVAEFDHLRVNVSSAPWLLCDLGKLHNIIIL